jgi:hypothetical protein
MTNTRKNISRTLVFKKNQKILRRSSKQKLQNMVKRKMTRTNLEIFCKKMFLPVYNLAQTFGCSPHFDLPTLPTTPYLGNRERHEKSVSTLHKDHIKGNI